MAINRPEIRIFLSSPGDVADEREIVAGVINGLAKSASFRERADIVCVRWDDKATGTLPMGSRYTPQPYVDEWLGTADAADLTIVILWSRLGTAFEDQDGKVHRSGTVNEFYAALKGPADPLVYFRTLPPVIDARDAERKKKLAELDEAIAFVTGDTAQVRSFNPYTDPAALKETVRLQLTEWLERRLAQRPEDEKARIWADYRGLSA